MKAILLLLSAIAGLLCAPVASVSALTVNLAPGTTLELSPVGEGDGAFLATASPISKRQFEAFANETNYRTEAERGTSGGFGYDPATKTVVQRAGYSWKNPGFDQKPDDPVVGVTRDDANAFLAWASRKAGRTLTLPSVRRWEMTVAAFPLPRPASPGTSVREWTADDAVQEPGQPPRVVLRGASWLQDANKPDLTALSNNASPGSRRPDFGFRATAEAKASPSPAPAATNTQAPQTQGTAAASSTGNTPDPASASVTQPPANGADALPATPSRSMGKLAGTALLLVIGLPLLVVVALIVAAVKAFTGKAIYAQTSSAPGPARSGSSSTGPTGGGVSASTVAGGIQVRGNVTAGTPLRVNWADGPADGLVVPYQPGPQGMFIPIEGTIRNLRVTTAGANGIVPGVAVTPVAGGFQVSASVPDGTTIHASWTDQSGNSQTGSARYDAASGHAFFATGSQPNRIAVSLQPITGQTLPANPPAGASQFSGGGYASGQGRGIRTYQDNNNFWTGFWFSDLFSGPSSTGGTISSTRNVTGASSFDDQSRIGTGSTQHEPPAYH